MRDAAFIFPVVVCELSAATAVINVTPVGQIGGCNDHVAPKSYLGWCGAEGGVVCRTQAECCGLQDVIDFVVVGWVVAAVQILGTKTVGDGMVDTLANGVCLRIFYSGRFRVDPIRSY